MKHLLKYVTPGLELDENLAIVGSSGRLLDSESGWKIDTHVDVVRFNRAPTIGFEIDVGSTETLRVANNHVFANVDIGNWGTCQPKDFIKNLQHHSILLIGPDQSVWQNREKHINPTSRPFLFDYSTMSFLKDFCGFNENENLSVGMAFIVLCVVSGLRPDVYGFDFEDDPSRTHYWETRHPPEGVHNILSEKMLLRSLADEGMINLDGYTSK